jgi:septal ring factor EnvC (AmiA/AmiB activator)
MFANLCTVFAVSGILHVSAAENAATVEQTRQTLAKWVETRQLISKTEVAWQSDKETIQQTIQLFERELATLRDQISKFSTNNTQVEKERAEAEALKSSSEEALAAARQSAATLESQIKSFVPRLPMQIPG